MVESVRLESVYSGNVIMGSNPIPSAFVRRSFSEVEIRRTSADTVRLNQYVYGLFPVEKHLVFSIIYLCVLRLHTKLLKWAIILGLHKKS